MEFVLSDDEISKLSLSVQVVMVSSGAEKAERKKINM